MLIVTLMTFVFFVFTSDKLRKKYGKANQFLHVRLT